MRPDATLVFVPGLLSDEVVWRPVADRLDYAGPTEFADVTGAPTITAMAESVLSGNTGPLLVVGHSMGGRVALEMARLAPDRVAGLALFDTGAHPRRDGEEAKREYFIRLAHTSGMDALADEWLPPMLGPTLREDPALNGVLRAMVARMSPAIHERQLRALLGRPDALSHLGSVACPVLLGVGRQDQWSPHVQHEAMLGLLPDARLVVIEDAGHFAPIEQPEAVAGVLREWVGSLGFREDRMTTDGKQPGPPPLPPTPLLDRGHSLSGYKLNKMAMSLMSPAGRAAFKTDEDAYLASFDLSPQEAAAVKARDWHEMVRLGGNLFFILKISAVDPTPITKIGAAQAGMEHEAFLTERLGKKQNG